MPRGLRRKELNNMSEMKFSAEAENILELIQKTDQSLFITGKAGTGKSTLLHHISTEIDPDIVVLAPTGIAAINVGGETIHSFFKLKPGYELNEAKHMRIDKQMISRFSNVDTIIIDEISMLRADILDAIDTVLRRARDTPEHFGGIRMIFFGDLFQLPPVLRREDKEDFLAKYDSPYFFSSSVFKQEDLFSEPFTLTLCELTEIYRQKDPVFTSILNAIRTRQVTEEQLAVLNKQVSINPEAEDAFAIHLVSTNAQANQLNEQSLKALKSPEIVFSATQIGQVENLRPNDTEVKVKVGAQVMFINNDSRKRWVNGSIGEVIGQFEEYDEEIDQYYSGLEVRLENKKVVHVAPYTWGISKYKFQGNRFVREEIGSFTQIPLKLAWAITIHKSQGKTFSHVKIDLGHRSFAYGQTYVALSRCRTLENMVLKRPVKQSDILVDNYVVEYFRGARV